MAFQAIVDPTNEQRELPWFNEFEQGIHEDISGQVFHVESVKSTPKGFILTTEFFNAWVWRKTALGESLIADLRHATQTDSHACLAISPNPKTKNKFDVGFLDDVSCLYEWNGESNTFILHPQKNLPLGLTPQNDSESKGSTPLGNSRKQSSAAPRTSVTSSKVQSSQ